MKLKWKIKPFEALTVHELYDLLKVRSEIFVVEQNCVYLDLDGKDKKALHLIGNMMVKLSLIHVYSMPELVLIMPQSEESLLMLITAIKNGDTI